MKDKYILVQETKQKEDSTCSKTEDSSNATVENVVTGSTSRQSWSALWSRYKNIWRTRFRGDGLKSTLGKLAIFSVGLGVIMPSFTGLVLSSFAGVFLVMYESYKNNIDPFVSSHIGLIASLPFVTLSIALVLTATSTSQAVLAGLIGILYLASYPLLYFVYSSIGGNMSD